MTSAKRLVHIDGLRGLAVLLMVMVHAAATWNPSTASSTSMLAMIVSGLGGLAAPLFVALLGWGLFQRKLTFRQRLVRSGFLVACQAAVNLVAPHLFDPFTPGVLSLMALLILSEPIWSFPLRQAWRTPLERFLLIAVVVLAFTLFASSWQGPSSWSSRIHVASVGIFVSHLLLTGTYPLIPWVFFAAFGMTVASTTNEERHHLFLFLGGAGLTASVLGLAYALHQDRTWALPTGDALLTFFPANTMFLVAALTGVVLLWTLAETRWSMKQLQMVGQCSLSVYVTHFIPFAHLHTLDQQYNWSLETAMLVVMVYTLVWAVLGTLWRKRAANLTLELMMRRFEKIS
ncbi:MAG: hypothetical protein CMA86_02375 [Euryarchaeota archaeon]|nr:hypothetical protein [Euryarchaeota archaeon]